MSDQASKDRLKQLLDYVQQVVRLPERSTFSVQEHARLAYFEHELDGASLNLNNNDWLALQRLQRKDPPSPPRDVKPWIRRSRQPNQLPRVRSSRVLTMTKREANKLVKAGVIDESDITPSEKQSEGSQKLYNVEIRLRRDKEANAAVRKFLTSWRRWAKTELPRRSAIRAYDDFFHLLQTLESGAAAGQIEVIWGIGMALWRSRRRTLRHPLLEIPVQLDIDRSTHEIRVYPSGRPLGLHLQPFVELDSPGLGVFQEKAQAYLEQLAERGIDVDPFTPEHFDPLLELASTLLSSSARYVRMRDPESRRQLPDPTESLMITDTWAIYARPRTQNVLLDELERLKHVVDAADELPSAALRLVTPPSSAPTYSPTRVDLATDASALGHYDEADDDDEARPESVDIAQRVFFPKEYNPAQVEIIRQLEDSDGVVVQGPPGTGKTHTISNIICHYLATGRRVLVTSQGESALNVLQEFIPEQIRSLTISLLTKDQEGMEQLEATVAVLANEVSRIDPQDIEQQIIAKEQKINELRKQLATCENEVREGAEKQLTPPEAKLFGSRPRTPAELADVVLADRDRHAWLPDSPGVEDRFEPKFDETDIAEIRQARARLGQDLLYIGVDLPRPGDLADGAWVAAVHDRLVNATKEEAAADAIPKLAADAENAVDRAESLLADLKELGEIQDAVSSYWWWWLRDLFHIWLEKGTKSTELFSQLLPDLDRIAMRSRSFQRHPVYVPELDGDLDRLRRAVDRAVEGKRPFSLLAFGQNEVKEQFAAITFEGKTPETTDEWMMVQDYLDYHQDIGRFVSRWKSVKDEFELPRISDLGETTGTWLAETHELICRVKAAADDLAPRLRHEIPELFPTGIEVEEVYKSRHEVDRAIEACELSFTRKKRKSARQRLRVLTTKLKGYDSPITNAMREFLEKEIGNTDTSTEKIKAEWQKLVAELARVLDHRRSLTLVDSLASRIESCGAPEWANTLRTHVVTDGHDPWTPDHWRESWNFKRIENFLRAIDGRERDRELAHERSRIEAELTELMGELVRLRTFLGLYVNMTDSAKSALVRFTAAVRHIGPGDGGVRAQRHRGAARQAMEDCYSAVPCWIMPVWRVSESLPSELGSFDLVIIDEASQSDILALPVLLRGKKLLIVGDDKQVSPTAPFVEERKLIQLKNQHLAGQPFVDLLMPGCSLYDLTTAVFPGRRVLLDEHFRCVEPLIRFSFRFYPEEIVPVRIAKASERIDPPLVDIYVPHGRRDDRKINVIEAKVIVDEIERLVSDPQFANRSIGVVSLIGAQQGVYIEKLLLRRIGQAKMLAHRISCGDSATFQGRERDIMFLSMVASPPKAVSQTSVVYQQRYNVALSRARDRMYLVRSVSLDDLNPNDLKARVIEHFDRPMGETPSEVADPASLCATDFEHDVYDALREKGFRVVPKLGVGGFVIDLVVEGAEDRRLAIQLEGDDSRDIDGWTADWARQKVLERVGWRFWRCWASSFKLDTQACLDDLWRTLAEMGIEPIGEDSGPRALTEHIVIDDPGQDAPTDDDQEIAILDPETEPPEEIVALGDRVLIAYANPARQYMTITLTDGPSDHDNGIYSVGDTVASLLIGAQVGDELELPIDGGKPIVTILEIQKPEPSVTPEGEPAAKSQA